MLEYLPWLNLFPRSLALAFRLQMVAEPGHLVFVRRKMSRKSPPLPMMAARRAASSKMRVQRPAR
jgi:hypothetical protein